MRGQAFGARRQKKKKKGALLALIRSNQRKAPHPSMLSVSKVIQSRVSSRSLPAHRYKRGCSNSSGEVVLTCLPAAKMTDFAHTSQFQGNVLTADGNASVLSGEVGLLTTSRVQNGTQPPVLCEDGYPLLATLVSVR